MKKITIITIVKNDEIGLTRTIASVLRSGIKCEHLIIDGSNHKLKPNNEPEYLRYVWGQDQGISDAFNKGALLANGEYIFFLNAGDDLLPDSALLIEDAINSAASDIAWFSVYRILESGQKKIYRPRLKYLPYAMSAPHQGLIMKRKIFIDIGPFPDQKYSMDHYLALRIISKKPKYKIKCSDSPIATYPSGGHSSKGRFMPFIYNIWNVLRIRPLDFPVALMVNIYLILKLEYARLKING
jgi:glycosyltransferase involved in cell wall biosynthesis